MSGLTRAQQDTLEDATRMIDYLHHATAAALDVWRRDSLPMTQAQHTGFVLLTEHCLDMLRSVLDAQEQ